MDSRSDYIHFLFKIKYETKLGEEIYIFGDHPDFGKWRKPKFKLNWTEGNIWQGEYSLPPSNNIIQFKFVCKSNSHMIWEQGGNRILSSNNLVGLKQTYDGKYILDCVWEHYKLTFNIHYKILDLYSEMRIVGSSDCLANWEGDSDKSVIMKWDEKKELIAKDGNINKGFWTVTVLMSNNDEKNYTFEYRYIIFNRKTRSSIWERDPNRHLELTTNLEENSSKLLITNSHLEINDINFVGKLLFDKMGDKNIFIGPYPQSEEDFKNISEKGVTEILNLQTDDDLKARQVNYPLQRVQSKKYGININRYPIEDYCHEVMVGRLKGASDILNELLEKGNVVYVHCTAGMYRASSTVILYLVLYESYGVDEAIEFCSKYRPIICPNVRAIHELSEKYKDEINKNKLKKSTKKDTGNNGKKKVIVKKKIIKKGISKIENKKKDLE